MLQEGDPSFAVGRAGLLSASCLPESIVRINSHQTWVPDCWARHPLSDFEMAGAPSLAVFERWEALIFPPLNHHSGVKFVVSRAGEAYDAQAKRPNRKIQVDS